MVDGGFRFRDRRRSWYDNVSDIMTNAGSQLAKVNLERGDIRWSCVSSRNALKYSWLVTLQSLDSGKHVARKSRSENVIPRERNRALEFHWRCRLVAHELTSVIRCFALSELADATPFPRPPASSAESQRARIVRQRPSVCHPRHTPRESLVRRSRRSQTE